jgi:hypothetical protein
MMTEVNENNISKYSSNLMGRVSDTNRQFGIEEYFLIAIIIRRMKNTIRYMDKMRGF